VDSSSIYVLFDLPLRSLYTVGSLPEGAHIMLHPRRIFSPVKANPEDESKNSSTGAIPGSSIDVTYGWECVRSVRRLTANTDINGDSECSIEEWDCTPRDTMPLDDESESLALDEDEDALHAT